MVTFENTLFVGKVLISLETVDSTNNYAKDLLSKSKPLEGTAIIAHTQHQGRGQIGNTWFSEPGKNLTLSIILYPAFLKAADQFGLTQAIALGICDLGRSLLHRPVHIKWPNDIYCEGKKLAGILVENSVAGPNLTDSVVGIGLNVNQTNFEGLGNATSMNLLGGREFELKLTCEALFASLEKRYLQLKNGHRDVLNMDYLRLLYRRKEWHSYKTGKGTIQGRILGVNDHGQLEMETKEGIRYFNNKEVEFV